MVSAGNTPGNLRVPTLHAPIIAELDKKFPLPIEPPEPGTIEPPEPGTIVHKVGRSASWTDEMTFMCVDPDDPDQWIVRDGEGDLDRYWYWQLALGPRSESDDR